MKYLLIICIGLFAAPFADAATMYFLPEKTGLGVGEEFWVDVKVHSQEEAINAVQATIHFPNSILELIRAEKDGSAFGFWVAEPEISNEAGTLTFIGGSSKGVAGSALQVIKLRMRTKGVGSADLTVSDAAITASDGKGTNVLSTIESSTVAVGTHVVGPAPIVPSSEELTEVPEKVERVAVKATGLPVQPVLRVPLYPQEGRWFSHVGETKMFWELPDDVDQVSTRISRVKDKKPGVKDEELFTGKNFGVLEEGVWYLRAQFHNNIGWGEIAYYEIKIDTTAPLPFEIKIDDAVSDNPTPEIKWETHDSQSGIARSVIFVGKEKVGETAEGLFLLPVLSPGKHLVVVRVFDEAGNSVEDDIELEVLPLPAPSIVFVTASISQNEFIFASGTSTANGFVDVKLLDKESKEVFSGAASTDNAGNWGITIDKGGFERGIYTVSVSARDERGAVSYPVSSSGIRVKAKTILSVGFVDVGWFEIIFLTVLVMVAWGSTIGWYYTSKKKKKEAYKAIAGRDIEKLSNLLSQDLQEVEEWMVKSKDKKLSARAKPEIEFHLQNMRNTVDRMKKYLGKEVGKLQ